MGFHKKGRKLSRRKWERVDILRREKYWQNRVGGQLQLEVAKRPGSRLVLEQQFTRIAEALGFSTGGRVLDVGCGTGTLLLWLMENWQMDPFGIDLSLTSLVLGQKAGLRKLLCGNAQELPIRDSSFSYVMCKGSVHHFSDAAHAMKDMHRVLVPGGKVVLYEPVATPLTSLVRRVFVRSDRYESPADLAYKEKFTAERFRNLLTDAGFLDIHISFHDVLAYPFSGGYLGGPFSRSARTMRFLLEVEQGLKRMSVLRRPMDFLAWRVLVQALKPDM